MCGPGWFWCLLGCKFLNFFITVKPPLWSSAHHLPFAIHKMLILQGVSKIFSAIICKFYAINIGEIFKFWTFIFVLKKTNKHIYILTWQSSVWPVTWEYSVQVINSSSSTLNLMCFACWSSCPSLQQPLSQLVNVCVMTSLFNKTSLADSIHTLYIYQPTMHRWMLAVYGCKHRFFVLLSHIKPSSFQFC